MPTDADGKQKEENAQPKRINHKEDAIEQSNPYHGDRNNLDTEGDSLVFTKTMNIGA